MTETTELISPLSQADIRNKIYTIRGVQVMPDSALAELYQVMNISIKKEQRDFNAQYGFLTVKITDEIYTWKNINAKFKNIAREG